MASHGKYGSSPSSSISTDPPRIGIPVGSTLVVSVYIQTPQCIFRLYQKCNQWNSWKPIAGNIGCNRCGINSSFVSIGISNGCGVRIWVCYIYSCIPGVILSHIAEQGDKISAIIHLTAREEYRTALIMADPYHHNLGQYHLP